MTFSHEQNLRRSTMTCLPEAKVHWSLNVNTRWRLTHLLDPNSVFHGRRAQSVAAVSSTLRHSWASLRRNKAKEDCAAVWRVKIRSPFEKNFFSILRLPGCRWLEPSGFSSVVSSQCPWCNQECILPRKLWVLCKSMVEFWSKLLDRQKINVKCRERLWLGTVFQISCRWTSMLFSSSHPRARPAVPVAFSARAPLPSRTFCALLIWAICCVSRH